MMSSANPIQSFDSESLPAYSEKGRKSAMGKEPEALADIYEEEVNIAIWQRELSATFKNSINEFLAANPSLQLSMSLSPQSALSSIQEALGSDSSAEISEDIAMLVDMFCFLFELKRAGLRLTSLDRAMCPRFHVDRVPGRLVTTYQGVATEWIPHQLVNREKLGRGSMGLADNQSGLFQSENDIQQLGQGDVAILKGELWDGNENAGLVHRSPAVLADQNRLLLTLDFSN